MDRKATLTKALDAVDRRPEDYGPPEQNFDRIACRWNVHIWNRHGIELDPPLNGADVAIMCADLKLARLEANPDHEDSWVDLAGYAACGAEVATEGPLGVFVGDELGFDDCFVGPEDYSRVRNEWRNAAADEQAATAAEAPKPKFKVGDRVLAFEGSTFVCTVEQVGAETAYLRFVDGSGGWYECKDLVLVPFEVGGKVHDSFGPTHPMTVLEVNGSRVRVRCEACDPTGDFWTSPNNLTKIPK